MSQAFNTNEALGRFALARPASAEPHGRMYPSEDYSRACRAAYKDTPLQTLMESKAVSFQPAGWIVSFDVYRNIGDGSIQLNLKQDSLSTARSIMQILLPGTMFREVWQPRMVCRYWFDVDGLEVGYLVCGTLHIYPVDRRRRWSSFALRNYESVIIEPKRR